MTNGDGQSRDEKGDQNKTWKNDKHRFHLLHNFSRNDPLVHIFGAFFSNNTCVFLFYSFCCFLGILNAFQLINLIKIPQHIFSKEFSDPRNYCLIRRPDVGFIFALQKNSSLGNVTKMLP